MPCSTVDYPNGRFITVEVNLKTGLHQLLNIQSLPLSKCFDICQSLGSVESGKHRHILLAHKDSGE